MDHVFPAVEGTAAPKFRSTFKMAKNHTLAVTTPSANVSRSTTLAEAQMPRIVIEETFWATALLTAQPLYQFSYDGTPTKSMECLGLCWGQRDGDDFLLQYAIATQVIEERDEQHVIGPDPFEHFDSRRLVGVGCWRHQPHWRISFASVDTRRGGN